ncbi:scavenger receptor cysteine-rich type 1 protein M130-like [Patiria miniata]|uniref:SRCR domain-containing protein n=1 Tax=Patiria miniata TaxID=46514 RepID=A0A914B0W6_PATMI|nr:scavenger receptor cysteine-rich type 1 protein M130-like [Patiria miniata]
MSTFWKIRDGNNINKKTLLVSLLLLFSVTPAVKASKDGDLRFGGSSRHYEGRLEIFYDGEWGTICDDDFGISEANVACRQMGYEYALDYTGGSYFGPGSGPVMLDRIYCWGSESRLVECYHSLWKVTDCTHQEDVGVICFDESVVLAPVYIVAISLLAIMILLSVTSCLWIAVKNRKRSRSRTNQLSNDTTSRQRGRTESNSSIDTPGQQRELFGPYPLLSIPQLPEYSETGDAPPPYEVAIAERSDCVNEVEEGGVDNEGFSNENNESNSNNRSQENRRKATTEPPSNVIESLGEGDILNTDNESE